MVINLNSPNDVVPHPDGSIWFTDPPYGSQLYEGTVDAQGGPGNPGHINPRLGQPGGFVPFKRELPTNVYRWDPSGQGTGHRGHGGSGSDPTLAFLFSPVLSRPGEALITLKKVGLARPPVLGLTLLP